MEKMNAGDSDIIAAECTPVQRSKHPIRPKNVRSAVALIAASESPYKGNTTRCPPSSGSLSPSVSGRKSPQGKDPLSSTAIFT